MHGIITGDTFYPKRYKKKKMRESWGISIRFLSGEQILTMFSDNGFGWIRGGQSRTFLRRKTAGSFQIWLCISAIHVVVHAFQIELDGRQDKRRLMIAVGISVIVHVIPDHGFRNYYRYMIPF